MVLLFRRSLIFIVFSVQHVYGVSTLISSDRMLKIHIIERIMFVILLHKSLSGIQFPHL